MKLIVAVLLCFVAAYAQFLEPISNSDPEKENACLLPIEQGNCRGSIRKWAYDQALNQCVPFMWTGCGGNRNRFPKKKRCELACRTSN